MSKIELPKTKPYKIGRPKKYQTPQALIRAINKYFKDAYENLEPITQTGLAIAIGMTRKQMLEYEGDPDFTNAVKLARNYVERYAETQLFNSSQSAGPIFALKNLGWSDKQEHSVASPDGKPIGFNINVVDPKED